MSTITIRRIEKCELFSGCRRSQLERIDQLGCTLAMPSGRTLCYEGEPGAEFFVLLDGLVDVHKSAGRLARLDSGGWFGETALLLKPSRLATVTTVVDSIVIVFGRREFKALGDMEPQVRKGLERTAELFVRGDAPTSQPWYHAIANGESAAATSAESRDAALARYRQGTETRPARPLRHLYRHARRPSM